MAQLLQLNLVRKKKSVVLIVSSIKRCCKPHEAYSQIRQRDQRNQIAIILESNPD